MDLLQALLSEEDGRREMTTVLYAMTGEAQHGRETRKADSDDDGGDHHLHQGEAFVWWPHGARLTRPEGATTTLSEWPSLEIV